MGQYPVRTTKNFVRTGQYLERTGKISERTGKFKNRDKINYLENKLPGTFIITCVYCDTKIPLFDLLEEKFGDPDLLKKVREMEKEAEEKKEEAEALDNLEWGITGKKPQREY
jgi:hypothetical protein